LVLCCEDSPSRYILCAGAGGYASSRLFETDGIVLSADEQSAENVQAQWDVISDVSRQQTLESGAKQTEKFLTKVMSHMQSRA
jgi:hypothetical protein